MEATGLNGFVWNARRRGKVPLRMRSSADYATFLGTEKGRAMACPVKLQMLQFSAAREIVAEDRSTFP